MFRILAALTLSTALAAPAFAEGMAGGMTCEAFNMLDQAGMMAAMEAAAHDAMGADGAMMSDGGAMEGDAMASEGGMMGADDGLAGLVKACADHPEMTVSAAMMPMN